MFCSDPVVNSSIGLLFEKILLQGEKARTRMEEPRLEDPRIGWRRTGESRSSSGRRARKEQWKESSAQSKSIESSSPGEAASFLAGKNRL